MLDQLLDFLHEAVYFVDDDLRITHWSAGAERTTGYHRSEVLGRNCRDAFLIPAPGGQRSPLKDTLRDGKPREWEAIVKHKCGLSTPVCVRMEAVFSGAGRICGAMESLASRDTLAPTPAPTRSHTTRRESTEARLCDELADYAERGSPFSVLTIVIEDLAIIRSHYGREAAEAVFRITTETLACHLRSFDFLGRWDDDRLLAVLRDTGEEGGIKAAARLCQAVERSKLTWWGSELPVGVSIAAKAVNPGDTIEQLLSMQTANA